jgi:hypothetical protein
MRGSGVARDKHEWIATSSMPPVPTAVKKPAAAAGFLTMASATEELFGGRKPRLDVDGNTREAI